MDQRFLISLEGFSFIGCLVRFYFFLSPFIFFSPLLYSEQSSLKSHNASKLERKHFACQWLLNQKGHNHLPHWLREWHGNERWLNSEQQEWCGRPSSANKEPAGTETGFGLAIWTGERNIVLLPSFKGQEENWPYIFLLEATGSQSWVFTLPMACKYGYH